ncbi:MAG: DNA primase [Planctomycetes bacterium]|nr:DNA primase [Planctomycetota bacterium]
MSEDLRRAIEAIKLRAPIEEIVRERVPSLKKTGALWVACCPFHEERTPSFKVDPRRGTWHCFGACGTGGDQLSFLERLDNLTFYEALEILAARTAVELPRRRSEPRSSENEGLEALVEEAVRFYRAQSASSEGQTATRYMEERGLTRETSDAFGVGYSPASGQALVNHLRSKDVDLARAEAAGLVRRNDQGRPYDFFRGRLMIPIRDLAGRAVGFGARRLGDGETQGPKYINTAETPLFHKGRLVYALDRALPAVRKCGQIVLVEGYTDVMAAHQVGLEQVVAVLGTATTDDHAGLIRRTGARRVTLVFDGDAAGQKAAYKALHGLLPLELPIDVVTLEGGQDPCDVLVREGARPLTAAMELARGWFEFLVEGLKGKSGAELSREVDRVLELLARLSKPVYRASLVGELAQAIQIPVEVLRAQGNALVRGRPAPTNAALSAVRAPLAPAQPGADARTQSAWKQLVGALLVDPGLLALVQRSELECPDPALARVLEALHALYADEEALLDCASILALLGDDPARELVVPLYEHARAAESARVLLEGQLRFLRTQALEARRRALEPALADEDLSPEEERRRALEFQQLKSEELRARDALAPGSVHSDSLQKNAVPTHT